MRSDLNLNATLRRIDVHKDLENPFHLVSLFRDGHILTYTFVHFTSYAHSGSLLTYMQAHDGFDATMAEANAKSESLGHLMS